MAMEMTMVVVRGCVGGVSRMRHGMGGWMDRVRWTTVCAVRADGRSRHEGKPLARFALSNEMDKQDTNPFLFPLSTLPSPVFLLLLPPPLLLLPLVPSHVGTILRLSCSREAVCREQTSGYLHPSPLPVHRIPSKVQRHWPRLRYIISIGLEAHSRHNKPDSSFTHPPKKGHSVFSVQRPASSVQRLAIVVRNLCIDCARITLTRTHARTHPLVHLSTCPLVHLSTCSNCPSVHVARRGVASPSPMRRGVVQPRAGLGDFRPACLDDCCFIFSFLAVHMTRDETRRD
ncbi:hypothetical protein B0J11DRAFT_261199 [Dendryphion nanum]|uniref:Uncharacterized protein n=1 Tax=Dendryphion nanum TaxID=256645 RepID=A0A9P9ITQ9_9PLEO|nr:hypothetical protein B0J11DRAFT_261199 [Dendryphion nanum]